MSRPPNLPPADAVANPPSVFVSYASEDRAAARAIRDGLIEAGLDVWYDENELGGGDAWDQKIRRQIRDCTYFLPIISATTERRSEGYFRREWRLACERTLDMADDVLFLLPVVIDDTSEQGARVPEKFVHVQWLRIPEGRDGAALRKLALRLKDLDKTRAAKRARDDGAEASSRGAENEERPRAGASLPPQVAPTFLSEVRMMVRQGWRWFKKRPWWIRYSVYVFLVIQVAARCSVVIEDSDRKKPEEPAEPSAKVPSIPTPPSNAKLGLSSGPGSSAKPESPREALQKAAKEMKADGVPSELVDFGLRLALQSLDGSPANRADQVHREGLAVVDFGHRLRGNEMAALATQVFTVTASRLASGTPEVSLLLGPDAEGTLQELSNRAENRGDAFLLTVRALTPPGSGLRLELYGVEDMNLLWIQDIEPTVERSRLDELAQKTLAEVVRQRAEKVEGK